MENVASKMFFSLVKVIFSICGKFVLAAAVLVLLYITVFFVRFRVLPTSAEVKLAALKIKHKGYDLMRWLLVDFKRARARTYKPFEEFGFTVFVGRQGAGKTVSMIEYLFRMKKEYPNCIIVTNFKCSLADKQMEDWRDFFEIRNEDKGVIFAIDEIHSEYDNSKWKDFPENLLSEISQQRKQRVKIVATSQAYKRMVKQMREQAFSVVECKTYFKRFTRCKVYDAFEYDNMESIYVTDNSIKALDRYSFVQTDELRSCYDTYEKIERLGRSEFIPRSERGASANVNIYHVG